MAWLATPYWENRRGRWITSSPAGVAQRTGTRMSSLARSCAWQESNLLLLRMAAMAPSVPPAGYPPLLIPR